MKTNMTISLDVDVVIALNKSKEKNRSALINSYLRSYLGLDKIIE